MAFHGAGVTRPRQPEDGKRSHEEERRLWTALLARLTHVGEVFSQPDVAVQLRRLGIRSTEAALASLAREYAKASQIALTTGTPARPHEVMHLARSLGSPVDLQRDFHELASGYRQLMQALALPADCSRHRWLEGRALLHVAQADALQRP
ncbi:MAG TPA: hypothetical protein VGE36_16410 [Roseateles sp.]